jgi:beta-glucosidase
MVTVLDGIRRGVSPQTELLFARGCDVTGESTGGFEQALRAAKAARAAIVVVGGKSGLMPDCTSGEFRDASDLGLTGVQQRLVEEVVATGTPTVVVLINGRVFSLPWIAAHVPAIVEAWLPGEEGGAAVAGVLFGRVNPAGRLPISLPHGVGQVPAYYNHKSGGGRSQMLGDYIDGPTRPLFPFGHGLGYTRFEYAHLEVSPGCAAPEETVRIAIDVRNAGPRDGEEVVQLYLRDVVASVTRPVKQLAGFKRIPLAAGESCRVTFSVDLRQLAFYDSDMRFVVEPGAVEAMVGASSQDVRARATFAIGGQVREVSPREVAATRVDVL